MLEYQDIIQPIIVSQSQSGNRLDIILSRLLFKYSRSRIKKWILNDQVTVDDIVVKIPKKKIFSGSIIQISHDIFCHRLVEPQNIPLDIVYEDDFIIVIDKPCNFVVHPGIGHLSGTLYNALLYYCPNISSVPRAGIVQRLDKDTTGLIVVAKSLYVQNKLIHLFRSHKIVREYEAIVFGNLSNNGIIREPIRRHYIKRTCMAVHPMGKLAVTHYRVIENFNNWTRLRLQLETGRTHQIRVHMSYINHPLIGDYKYGKFMSKDQKYIKNRAFYNCIAFFNRQALHACMLSFNHPITGVFMKLEIPLPDDMINLLNILRLNT